MNIVVTVDNNWAIGSRGNLLVSIPNDQKMFRELTAGKVVVMGRRTLESFPQGMPLPNRNNIVLSRNTSYKVRGAMVVHSLDELMDSLKQYRTEDVFVIGGSSIYEQLIEYCDVAHVTMIDHEYSADTHFCNLDKRADWEITADSDEMTYFDLPYTFLRYERVKNSKK